MNGRKLCSNWSFICTLIVMRLSRAILAVIFTWASLNIGARHAPINYFVHTCIHTRAFFFTLALVSLHRASLRSCMSQCWEWKQRILLELTLNPNVSVNIISDILEKIAHHLYFNIILHSSWDFLCVDLLAKPYQLGFHCKNQVI